MTVSGTWVPPGPSKRATGRPPSSIDEGREAAAERLDVERGHRNPLGRRMDGTAARRGAPKTADPVGSAVIVVGRGRRSPRGSGRGADALRSRRDGDLVGDDLDEELDLLADEPAACSRAMFQFRPQSSRSSVAWAVNAMWRPPFMFVVVADVLDVERGRTWSRRGSSGRP